MDRHGQDSREEINLKDTKLDTGGTAMNCKSMLKIGITTVWLVVLVGVAISAQDKYTVKVAGRARVFRVQGIRSVAGDLHQSERKCDRDDPR